MTTLIQLASHQIAIEHLYPQTAEFLRDYIVADEEEKYDVVLYVRPPHQYVLHRVVEVREHDYVILGDNCDRKEYGITDDDILGVLTSFRRKGRDYEVEDIRYRMYYKVWYALYPLRKILMRGKRMLRTAAKRLVRRESC